MIPSISACDIPSLTTAQMIAVDRAMMEDYRIDLPRMMENAGRALASITRTKFLKGKERARKIIVLAGAGGNGGGALVAARHLHNWGGNVTVLLAQSRSAMTPTAAHQLEILDRMGVRVFMSDRFCESRMESNFADLIIDGIIGYSLRGAPHGSTATLIRAVNASLSPVVALDVPSGVDAGTGDISDPAIVAEATLTLALPKKGLLDAAAAKYVGELYCADISVPPALYKKYLSKHVPPIFSESAIIRVAPAAI